MMGQLVGTCVELLVGQRFAVLHHGDGVRLALGLDLESPMHRLALGEIAGGGIELAQQGFALRCRQDRQLTE